MKGSMDECTHHSISHKTIAYYEQKSFLFYFPEGRHWHIRYDLVVLLLCYLHKLKGRSKRRRNNQLGTSLNLEAPGVG